MYKLEEYLTFNDVLIKPQYSEIRSRSDIDLSVSLSKGFKFNFPVFPANMVNTVDKNVAEEMYKLECLSLLHRFCSVDEQLNILKELSLKYENIFNYVGISIGVKKEDYENIQKFIDLGIKIICIDVAHGHNINCIEMIKFIYSKYPNAFLIAGNVATAEGAVALWLAGADACKVNIGAGGICSTRLRSGSGVPQFSALMEIWNVRNVNPLFNNKIIIADGGCSSTGDLVKSLCFSELVMSGNMFAGSIDHNSEIIENNGKKYKRYDGSSTLKSDYIEGFKSLVEVKSSIKDIIEDMRQGISSGCSYVGAKNLTELQQKAKFIKITNAGLKESGAHDVFVLGK